MVVVAKENNINGEQTSVWWKQGVCSGTIYKIVENIW